MKVILVTGGRDFTTYDLVSSKLSEQHREDYPLDMIIQGGARGADALARRWCTENGVPCLTVPAEWEKLGGGAGPIRNSRMVNLARDLGAYLCLAFGGMRGTNDTIRKCHLAGIPVHEFGRQS